MKMSLSFAILRDLIFNLTVKTTIFSFLLFICLLFHFRSVILLSNALLLLTLTLKHDLTAYVYFQIKSFNRTAGLPNKTVLEACDA